MKFEEALKLMREGKKITHKYLGEDIYLMGCYMGLVTEPFGLPPEDFEEMKKRGMSIVKMKGDRQHPDMLPRLPFIEYVELLDKYPFLREQITYPTINLLLIMSDDWEIVE